MSLTGLLERWLEQMGEGLESLGARQLNVPISFQPTLSWRGSALQIKAKAWEGGPLGFGRCVHIDGGSQLQILNAVHYPKLTIPAPIFSLEVLAFGGGLHLFVLDLLMLDDQVPPSVARVHQVLEAQRVAISAHFTPGEKPAWGERVFSDQLILHVCISALSNDHLGDGLG